MAVARGQGLCPRLCWAYDKAKPLDTGSSQKVGLLKDAKKGEK